MDTTPERLFELSDRLEALRKARASGVRRVEFESGNGSRRLVEYRTDSELAAAIADLERQIAQLRGARRPVLYINSSKGV